MKIILVAATVKEAENLWNELSGKGPLSKGINTLMWKGIEIELLITGVGLMPTAFHLGETLTQHHFDFAINFGVAGSFNRELKLGEVVNVTEDLIADAGAEDKEEFLNLVEMQLLEADEFPYSGGKLIIEKPIQSSISRKVRTVKGISLNKATGSEKTLQQLKSKYNPDVESLEGAAFIYSCLHKNISCLQLRAISNYVEPRNRDNWQLGKAIENITETVVMVLEEISAEYKKSL